MKKLFLIVLLFLFGVSFVSCDKLGITTTLIEQTTTEELTTEIHTTTDLTTEPTTIDLTTTELTTEDISLPSTLSIQFAFYISFTPENMEKFSELELLLENALNSHGYDIDIQLLFSSDYDEVDTNLEIDIIQIAYTNSFHYAYLNAKNSNSFEPLLSNAREGFDVQFDSNGDEIKDIDTLVDLINAESYDGSQSNYLTNCYYAMILIRTNDLDAYETNGLSALEGKTIAGSSFTSSAGFLYPAFLLDQYGLSPSISQTIDQGEYRFIDTSLHSYSVNSLLNEEVDAAFTYMDARIYHSDFDYWMSENPDINLFDYTSVIGLVPIYNDLFISASYLDADLKEALKQSFLDISLTQEGSEIFQLFNANNFISADDSDYPMLTEQYQYFESNGYY